MATRTHRQSRTKRTTSQKLWQSLSVYSSLSVVAAMGVIVPSLGGPRASLPWDGMSGVALQVGALVLIAIALWCAEGRSILSRLLSFARRGPNPWALGLLAWGLASLAFAHGTRVALQGMLQLLSGLTVYACVAYRTRRSDEYKLLLDGLAAATILLSLLGLANLVTSGGLAFGGLSGHRLFGAFLMLMVPVMLAYSWVAPDPHRRLMAQAAAGLGLIGLLAAHWPPALRGAALALLLVGLMSWRLGLLPRRRTASVPAKPDSRRTSSRSGRSQRRWRRSAQPLSLNRRLIGQTALYGGIAVVSLILFLGLTPRGVSLLQQTSRELAAVSARSGRLLYRVAVLSTKATGSRSEGAGLCRQTRHDLLAMVEARPVQGWGIGSFAVYQQRFTHQGDAAGIVGRNGPQPIDRPQSLYLPLAAELGVPGLALWAGMLAAFFLVGTQALRRPGGGPLRQLVLIGSLAAVAGQVVDAFTDGSWQYGAVSLFFWIVLGLGTAAAGVSADDRGDAPDGKVVAVRTATLTPARVAVVCLVSAVSLALIVRAVS